VVLGKIAATSLNGFYGLLAVLPVLAVPLLLGWWLGLGMAADLGFGFAAWHQLRTRFRGLASQRFMSVMETKPQPRKGINHGCPAPLSTGLSGPEIFFREKTGNGAVLALQIDSSILFIGLGSF
jgi:hypothetical protein